MQVYLTKDVEGVGMAGSLVKVKDGYAINFLLPRKFAIKVNKDELDLYKSKSRTTTKSPEVLNTKLGMLAERIRGLHFVVKKRVHDDGKLYGAVGADEVVTLLKSKEVAINRKQVVMGKAIRAIGEHKVGVKLNAKLNPEFVLKVVAQK